MIYKKILAVTITHNRLETTKKFIGQLKEKAGYPFEHIIIDNGSHDDTVYWLKKMCYNVVANDCNEGIVSAWIKGVKIARLLGFKPDYILKFDDDCEIETENILAKIMDFYSIANNYSIVAPRDMQILPSYLPEIVDKRNKIGDYNISITSHVGGMFAVLPVEAFDDMARQNSGQGVARDCDRGWFWRSNGYQCVYLNDLKVHHRGEGITNYTQYKF